MKDDQFTNEHMKKLDKFSLEMVKNISQLLNVKFKKMTSKESVFVMSSIVKYLLYAHIKNIKDFYCDKNTANVIYNLIVEKTVKELSKNKNEVH